MSSRISRSTNLEELLDALIERAAWTLDRHGDWSTDLPTFGGEEPDNTDGIWSWSDHYLLVGTCADDLEIVDR